MNIQERHLGQGELAVVKLDTKHGVWTLSKGWSSSVPSEPCHNLKPNYLNGYIIPERLYYVSIDLDLKQIHKPQGISLLEQIRRGEIKRQENINADAKKLVESCEQYIEEHGLNKESIQIKLTFFYRCKKMISKRYTSGRHYMDIEDMLAMCAHIEETTPQNIEGPNGRN